VKKLSILFFLLLSGQTLFAQTPGNYDDFKKWSYGITAGGTSNYRILTSDGSENFLKDNRNNSETRRIGFSAGLVANYRISSVLSINSGLVYDDMGYKTKDQLLSYSDGSSVTASTAFHYRYVSLPLDLKYDFLRNRTWNLYVAGGVSPAVFIGEATVFSYNGTKNTDNNAVGSDRFNFIGDVRTGVDFWIADNLKLNAGLFYRQFINATNSNLPTKAYLNAAGINAGIVYLRKKKNHR
jgi:hypothetical protein